MPIGFGGSSSGGGGGSGTVTNVSSADTSIAVANPTTTPTLTIAALKTLIANEGLGAGFVAGLVNALPQQVPTAVKTSAYNAQPSDFIPVDTTSGSVTITLPTAPVDATCIAIKQVTRGGANTVTYACGGSDVLNKAGGPTSGTITYSNQGVWLLYQHSTAIWYVIGADLPQSAVVQSVAAADTSVVVGGTATAPTVRTGTLDVIAADHPAAADWSNNSHKITSVLDPASAQDAATKNYVDTALNGLNWKAAVLEATATALPANVYANGSSGVGATLTGVGFGALTVDGQAVNIGDRILVKNEAAPANNGIYVVTTVGAVATLYVLTRAADYNQASELAAGDAVYAVNGTANADTSWVLTSAGPFTIGTTALNFTQFGGNLVSSVFSRTGAVVAVSGDYTLNQVGNATGDYSLNSHKITSLLDPTSAQDASTKNYADTHIASFVSTMVAATSTQTQTANTTLTNDTALSFVIGASATEVWFVEIFYDFNAANATMDIKFGWAAVPSGATIRWGMGWTAGGSTMAGFGALATSGSPIAPLAEGASQAVGTGTATTHQFIGISGFVYGGGTGGTIHPQWAQNTSDAGNLIRNIGSFLRATKLVA